MGRYRSLQSIMLAEALKGITDNQTITAYKKDCKLFAAYCKEQGVLLAKRCRALNPNMQELLHLSEETILCSLMKQLPECERKILENIEKIISILIY